jgi:hypothetical protein
MAATATAASAKTGKASDRRIVLAVACAILVLITLFAIFGPETQTEDYSPTSYNSQTGGVKAAYLLLSELGYNTDRWTKKPTELSGVDAAKTTLILTEPTLPMKDQKLVTDAIADFLNRGGRILATGANGARLLPGGRTGESSRQASLPAGQTVAQAVAFCETTPESAGTLAQAGSVAIEDDVRWTAEGPQYRVEQRCGCDAVVVEYRYGKGEAIWWSAATPMTNGGLSRGSNRQDAALKLLLASVGGRERTVLFDEYFHHWHSSVVEDQRKLPWWSIFWQCLVIAVLLLLSRGRRNGPIRMPVALPRTSPIEFAMSMGRLYDKAGATAAATGAAHDRLLEFLETQCGLPREVLRAGPTAIAEALRERFGGDWRLLEAHLEQVAQDKDGGLRPKVALKLVQALEADQKELAEVIRGQAQAKI